MKSQRCLFLLSVLLPATVLFAQQRDPHIGYVYPAGGHYGTTVDATIGGQYITGVTNVYVSGTGVQAYLLPFEPFPTQRQVNDYRERLQELQKGTTKSPEIQAEMKLLRKKIGLFEKRRLIPALAELISLRIVIAPNAAPGNRDLRIATYTGLSNPIVFQVGMLPEFQEPDRSDDKELMSFNRNRRTGPSSATGTNAAISVTLPATINGQIMPGEVDRYRFKARQGQQLVVSVSARELIPYLADAVPGWFQAKAVLYDGQGKELAYDDHYLYHPDPVLFYNIQKEGDYILEIRDSLYRGREDFVYRVAIGELPFITNVYPLGGHVGGQSPVTLWGVNLPFNQYNLNLLGVAPGNYPFSVPNKGLPSNHVSFKVDTIPECHKRPGANSPTNAQYVTLPMIINGHIDQPGDVDVFRFDGRAGDKIVAEVYARRLDSPLDSVLKLTDAAGKQVAFNDDHEDKGSGLNTHHADSYITATLPASGAYFLHLWDAQQKGGWAYSYRLRISPPRPDFELRAAPSSISVRQWNSATIGVYALRRDGFSNTISVTAKNLPDGYKFTGSTISGTQDQTKVTLTVGGGKTSKPTPTFNLQLEGRATIEGREVVHSVIPSDDMMQAFAYRHLVPANELKIVMATGAPPEKKTDTKPATPAGTKPTTATGTSAGVALKITSGGTARQTVKLPTANYAGKLQFEMNEPPNGITLKDAMMMRDSVELVFTADATKAKPGQSGELIVTVYATRTNTALGTEKKRASVGTLPPIRYQIVAGSTSPTPQTSKAK
jgi:hypothetical protein